MGITIWHRLKPAAGVLCAGVLALSTVNCIDKPLEPVGPTWETQASVPFSQKSYTLADLLGKDSIYVSAAAGTSPLTFSLSGGLFKDTVSIGDSSDSGQGHTFVDQKTASDFNSLKIHVVIDNAIPVQFAVKLQFLDGTSGLLINVPQTSGDSITVAPPDAPGGVISSPSHTERIINLGETEIQQFNKAYSLAYFIKVSAPGTNLSLLKLSQTINLRVWAEFSYQVNR
jgi:hypothetical protein